MWIHRNMLSDHSSKVSKEDAKVSKEDAELKSFSTMWIHTLLAKQGWNYPQMVSDH
uniref:Uncharacterized protein n=1 Tax=Anguilla anguilla TaxID=7936 RepID=A0A0E9XTD5_ANGAN